MRFDLSRVSSAAFVVGMFALSACSDTVTTTSPELRPQQAICRACGGGGEDESPPVITSVSFPKKTFSINGPAASYTANVSDPSGVSGLSIVATLVQGSATRSFAGTDLWCGPGVASCVSSGTVSAAGFASGAATVRINLVDEHGAVASSVSVAVTLISGIIIPGSTDAVVAISELTIPSTTFTIGAPSVNMRTTVLSKIASFYRFRIRAVIVQQQASTAFEVPIPCGEGQVICNFVTPFALPAGVTAGPARLELQVIDSAFGTIVQRLTVDATIAGQ